MKNRIDRLFARGKRTRVMAHAVAGYPDLETSIALVEQMAAGGADLVEIQIPFSDPLADGPTIMSACHRTLQNGFQVEDALRMVERLRHRISTPIVIMTYANVPFRMGFDRFVKATAAAGASGLIIPDLPFDEPEEDWMKMARAEGIHPISVVSPGMDSRRLDRILKTASGFLYITLRIGTTGAGQAIAPEAIVFIGEVRKRSRLPIAAGFGVSSPEHAALLKDKADIVIVGSRLIDTFHAAGGRGVSAFLKDLQRIMIQE